jgi:acyl transferase domain-containing protein/D-arabinose 1-dehydrogenase-like Zn-dependent alcohol dehydrogenase/acyl carrier protein
VSNEEKLFSYLKKVTADLRTAHERLREVEEQAGEPIAIIGMSCRYPGGVTRPDELWELVASGGDGIGQFPADRGWDLDSLGATIGGGGGFLTGAGDFDPGFFGISPREALAMDPQQRLLLETAWEVFEDAGISADTVRGSRTGVFVGSGYQGYGAGQGVAPAELEGYVGTGSATSVMSGRIAYVLGLEGPAVTVDTACSSSLVALHLAAQALRHGECTMALAGGVAVMAGPGMFVEFSKQGGLAGDGRCKSFAASADGTGWAEGAGLILVERLSDARRLGHRVLAVIRGSAVNQDGASSGLTAPNGPAQQRVIRQALANARLSTSDVDVVEAHGTGTTLGDPIEAQALLATYGQDRDRPLLLGSVKSNIGHAQAAAGAAGVIKTVLALRHGIVPATLHVNEPTPHVSWSAGAVELVTGQRPWPEADRPRRAAVSAFGVSGTNAHVILEQAEPAESTPETATGGVLPWVISGRTDPALRAQAARLREVDAESLAAVGRSLVTSRALFERRAVVLGETRDELLAGLDAVAAGDADLVGTAGPVGRGPVFVFPGQGAQWVGMGRELLESSPVFRESMEACAAALQSFVDWSLLDVLGDEAALARVDVVQPVSWAVMMSLAAVWQSYGVRPAAVIGHSQGEIAAACVAGVLSLETGARIVATRSRVLAGLSGTGGMVWLPLTAEDAAARIDDRLAVAATNGPHSTVVSGDPAALDELLAAVPNAKRITVDYASHSAHIDPLRAELLSTLNGVDTRPGRIAWRSTVTGDWIDPTQVTAEYWFDNLRRPVRFHEALQALQDHRVFIEVSPHPVLTPAIQDTLDDLGHDGVVVDTLRRDQPERRTLLASLARAFVHGLPVDWAREFPPGPVVALPTYPFQRERFWLHPTAPITAGPGDGFWDAVRRGEADELPALLGAEPDDADSWRAVLPSLSRWYERRERESAVDQWCYQVTWQPLSLPATATLSTAWLIVTDADRPTDAAAQCVRAIETHGGHAVTFHPEPGATPAELARRLAELADGEPVGVLAALDLPGTVALVQALGLLETSTTLWCATRSAVSLGGTDPLQNPEQAMVWGLGRVVALEHPGRWGGLIDLPATWDDRSRTALAAVLCGATGEDQVALRRSGVFGQRLTRGRPVPRTDGDWQPRGTVLITGGIGVLGGHVARWLAAAGAPHLVLTGRRGPDTPGVDELCTELTALGTEVTVVACDITDRAALARVLDDCRAHPYPLCGVIHAAGIGGLGPVAELTPADLDAQLAAKVTGAASLDELLAGDDLDAFVLFSSAAGVWGSGGQAGYSAANAYLDALARHRRGRGRTATAVAWGFWAGADMGDDTAAERLRRQGLRAMPPDLAVTALRHSLAQDLTCTVIADVDWPRFSAAFTIARPSPLLTGLATEPAEAPAEPGGSPLRDRLAALSDKDRKSALLDTVCATAARVLGLRSAEDIAPDRVFRDLGFDSLTAVEFRDRMRAETGLRLPATLVFDRPTPNAVADHLATHFLAPNTVVTREVAPVSAPDEPIAIIGMSCRLPGAVASPGDLWDLVFAGCDGVGEFPDDRGWDVRRLFDPDPDHPGTSYTRHGGFLYDAGKFDPAFFGISPREALAMDPQQRLLLETSWEVLERTGIAPESVRGSRAGVFVGSGYQGYGAGQGVAPADLEGYFGIGSAASVMSGRIAYTLGLEGPAMTVDTGCSSSLVALHLAAQALRQGECDLALAGGVTVMASAKAFVEFSRQRGLAADGRCKSFAAAADGTGWAEGAGMLLVERLSDAHRRRHPVLAVIRGSAINQDGASNGLTAPNGPAQQRVIRQALANARLSTSEVDVVEAHGTGTRLGDPIEAQALLATYGQDRETPLLLGSVKSNIGHTQSAAGVAGVIKMVQALRHGIVPATLHVDKPSPHVDWSAGAVELVTERRDWPAVDRPRRAAVSSFGMSGTNAHLILEQAPAEPAPPADGAAPLGVLPWVVSGRSEPALRAQAERLREFTAATSDDLGAVARSLVTARSRFEHRAVVLGESRDELLSGLASVAAGEPDAVSGVTGSLGPGVVFAFPGQGAQWVGMGRELLDSSPVFGESMRACAAVLESYVDWSLLDVLGSDDPELWSRVDVVQPVSWAVMVSLAAVWQDFGVRPAAVVGHSQGEIAAACVAGFLSLDAGARIVATRSRALLALSGTGGMVWLPMTAEQAVEHLDDRLGVAAMNGPYSTVVSGDADALADLLAAAPAARRIAVDYASHSAHVDPLREELLAALDGLRGEPGDVAWLSTVTGEPIDPVAVTAEYWYENLRRPVRFHQATQTLLAQGYRAFVEISPHPVLAPSMQETVEDAGRDLDTVVVGTLRRDQPEVRTLLTSLARAFAGGIPVDWTPALPTGARHVPLPTYAFQRSQFWLHSGEHAADPAALGLTEVAHPMLGAEVELPGQDVVVLTGRLSLDAQPWLADHAVAGTVLFPGTGFVELLLAAGDRVGCPGVRELTLHTPLVLAGDATGLRIVVEPPESGARAVRVYARPDDSGEWTCHASGVLGAADTDLHPGIEAWPPADAEPVSLEGFYEKAVARGYEYGPAFQGLRAVWRRGEDVYAEVALPGGSDEESFAVHPALLDSALQAMGFLPASAAAAETDGVRLPFSWTGISLHAEGATALRVLVRPTPAGVSVAARDGAGLPVLSVRELVLRPVSPAQLGPRGAAQDSLFAVDWPAQPLPPQQPATGRWAYCLPAGDVPGESYPGVPELLAAVRAGAEAPDRIVLPCPSLFGAEADPVTGAHELAGRLLGELQAWLAAPELAGTDVLVLTSGAVAAGPEDVPNLADAPVPGLVRTARTENSGRISLVDTDDPAGIWPLLPALAALDESEIAVRTGEIRVPRLVRALDPGRVLTPPPDVETWHLGVRERGTLENLAFESFPEAAAPLAAGQVRVAVHAAGVNFRDVLVTLGMVALPEPRLGSEAAGIVLEVAPDVTRFRPGDRVMGLFVGAFGPTALADQRMLTRMPAGWSFETAAAVPIAYTTAFYGLVDLGGLSAGESVLVHAAAGGVGSAGVRIAHHLGARVFATASPPKWDALRAMDLPDDRIASSRTLDFADRFGAVDVVLNSLAGGYVDRSLGLLGPGGRFIEMGKTDIRDADTVATDHPGVFYRAFDTNEAGLDRLCEILDELTALFERGALTPLPVRTWDIGHAREAFRFLSQGRNIGKIVLTVPQPLPADGTVMVTGGTGTLGRLVARHLVHRHGARRLLLVSRTGADAEGVPEFEAELAAVGATVRVARCDVADRAALRDLLATVPAEHPLTAVIHTAGALRDGVLGSLDRAGLDAVLAPKADAAMNLHELTRHANLSAFVLFSSAAATFGSPGQGNYAAANAFLDALAYHRRARHLPALSLGWGYWAQRSGLTGHLSDADVARMDRAGATGLATDEALALLDTALRCADPLLVPVKLDVAGLRAAGAVPPLLRGLLPAATARRRARAAEAPEDGAAILVRRLATLTEPEQERLLLDTVRAQAATVLGHASAEAIEPHRGFMESGFDSLTAVELRNRLKTVTGLTLPATLIFDHPAPDALARYLRQELAPASAAPSPAQRVLTELSSIERSLPLVAEDEAAAEVTSRLRALLDLWSEIRGSGALDELDSASDEDMFDLIGKKFGIS